MQSHDHYWSLPLIYHSPFLLCFRKSKIQELPAVDKVLRNYEYRHYDPKRTIALTPEEVSEVKAMDMSRLLEQLAHEKEHMFLRYGMVVWYSFINISQPMAELH